VVVACGSDDGDTGAGPTTTSVVPRPAPALSGDPFTLGVASGDPTADGVVLWTRLAPDSGEADGGMPADDVDVVFEIAKDSAFTDVVATGVATAVADLAHSVHVEVDGLDPNAEFHYRFSVGEFTSPAGVTRTFSPGDATLDRYRFAVAACQDFQFGRYGAWAHAAADGDLDAVVFMGDYVYELPPFDVSPEGDGSRMWRVEGATTLDDYRIRYAQVKEDSSLQSAHAMAPWLIVWDDHEVTDNYTGDTDYNDPDPVEFRKRRSAAYQAWYEHLPVRLPPPPDLADADSYPVHRSYRIGDLIDLTLLDTRQFADPTPCRDTASLDTGPGCAERDAPDRTLLGEEQLAWFAAELEASTATWTVMGNPVMLSGFDASAGEGEPTYYLESWDGYTAERAKVLDLLAAVDNPIVLTGDFHASFVLDALAADGTPVAPEFLATGISSLPFDAPTAGNPQVRFAEARNGYLVCEVTPESWTTEFRHVVDVWDPESAVEVGPTFTVRPGERTATEV